MKKILCLFIAVLMCCLSFAACDKNKVDAEGVTLSDEATDYVVIRVKKKGDIVIKLFPETAPKTVENFKKLVSEGFYDGLIFHRVIENFMIQGGDPKGDGSGGSSENIYGEFTSNGFSNNLMHKRGVVSMARRSDNNNSASSQFFIMHVDYPYLDGDYASFGYVIHGMDVVDAIATVDTYSSNDKPKADVVIEWARFANVEEGSYTVASNIFDTTTSTGGNGSDTNSGQIENETHAPHDAPAYKDIDFSTLTTLDGVTESDTPTDYVMIKVEGKGDIVIRLYPNVAPVTVENFKKLVSEKFYDGLIFHRVIENFMIQGGDPNGNGTGGSDKNIIGEFSSNDFENNLKHVRGVISMARATPPNSASSQFFIVHETSSHLDGQYASFGYVVYGMDVVDAVAKVSTNYNDRPYNDVVMTSVRFVNLPVAE